MRVSAIAAVAAVVLLSFTSATAFGQSTGPDPCATLSKAVERYMTARARVQNEVLPLRVTSDVAEIRDRSNTLAYAIQRARPNAKQGEFFDAPCGRQIAEQFSRALEGFDIADFMIGLEDEPADSRPPQVHMRYPNSAAMATMPANLLSVLPELPDSLEYRLIGRHLVLRDVDAALILDYFTDAMPPARSTRR